MIDLETHCIVDIIDSRDTYIIVNWLKDFPNLEIIVRDGSFGYRAAINAAHPSAIQINDRFHIIKNLVTAITKTLKREIPGRIEIPIISESAKKRYEYLMGLSRRERILEAKKLYNDNITKNEISRQLGVGTTTITKYINMKESEIPEELVDTREQEHINAINKIKAKVAEVKTLSSLGMTKTDISIKTGYPFEMITSKNAIKYEYNNGLAEGSVNKIKSIKRIMYGRNKFTLLRRKLLALEALK